MVRDWIQLPSNERAALFQHVSDSLGLSASSIEKDFWVTVSLLAISQLSIVNEIVFKGGTSLSKGWDCIQRFSEDVDLGLNPSLVGIAGELSNTQAKNLRRETVTFVRNTFIPIFNSSLLNILGSNEHFTVQLQEPPETNPDQDPVCVLLGYQTVLERKSDYLRNDVVLEMGFRSGTGPAELRTINSILDQNLSAGVGAKRSIQEFSIRTIRPTRTFIEKLFLLHEEFTKPSDKIRHLRMSRHLYDIDRIASSKFGEEAIANNVLYEQVLKHRIKYTRIKTCNYEDLTLNKLAFMPPQHMEQLYATDYLRMQNDMLYGASKSYQDLIASLHHLNQRIAALYG